MKIYNLTKTILSNEGPLIYNKVHTNEMFKKKS